MGGKGGAHHLKREKAPVFWHIQRKRFHWAVKPNPGPHPADRCITLLTFLRDMLKIARNRREAKIILNEGHVLVDGKVRRDYKFPVGLMDVISIPKLNKNFRILVSRKGLVPREISPDETSFKLCRINNKTTVKGGDIQLNLHDGRNILIRVRDPMNPVEDVYKTGDTIIFDFESRSIKAHLKMREGAYGLVVGGGNIGKHGKIVRLEKGTFSTPPLVVLEKNGETFTTIRDYVFIVGEDKPVVRID